MRFPIVTELRRLDSGPRRFLFFIVFNVASWQCIVGPAMILFARSLNMKPSLVGFLISFMPLSMLLIGFTVPLINHFGPKRVMLVGWLLRNLLVGTVFLIPLVRGWGQHYAQYMLMIGILAFCILRALGAGGWLPWLSELVSDNQRGTYFSMESAITQLTSIAVALIQAVLLIGRPSDWRFLAIYGLGMASGLTSLVLMKRIPGGHSARTAVAPEVKYSDYGRVLRDRAFIVFVATASLGQSSLTWLLGSAMVMYMRDGLGLSGGMIMTITAAGSLGISVTISSWGRFSDYSGSASAMFWSMLGHALCGLACIVLVPDGRWTTLLLWSIFILASVLNAAFNVAANRAMLGYLLSSHRVVYTNAWSIGTSLAVGLTPIAAGYLIDHFHRTGFNACFVITALTGIVCALMSRIYVRESNTISTGSSSPNDVPEIKHVVNE